MEKKECLKIKEEVFLEKLDNGLKVIIIPKKGVSKKFVIWGTEYGSIDNRFIDPKNGKIVAVPDGVAHFLEHKMFEQESGINSLDKLMALGVEANAYTTNDYTAYLIESSQDENFYEALDEFMDYVQSPYYTDENVEKEKGIIGQEIKMYDDDPGFQLYLNALKCMYINNPIKIDIAGTVQSISEINPDILYKCYNTFYHPSNMVLVVSGDFVVEDILKEIKLRLKYKVKQGEIQRIYESEPDGIAMKSMEKVMSVSMPIFMIGIKDRVVYFNQVIKRQVAIEIINEIIAGNSSRLYKELYEKQLIFGNIDFEYDVSKKFAHVLVSGQSNNPQLVKNMWISEVNNLKKNGLNEEDIERIKRKLYGEFVTEFNDVSDIGRMFVSDTIRGINTFDFIEKYDEINKDFVEKVMDEVFIEDKMVMSVIKGE